MPKRMRQQRAGKGTPLFRAPSFRYKYKICYIPDSKKEDEKIIRGKVMDIVHDSARSAPVMILKYQDGRTSCVPAAYGIKVGAEVHLGEEAPVSAGNILPLKKIPAGQEIFNLELKPGDGGKIIRSAGTSAKIVSHDKNKVVVKLPSKKFKSLPIECRATIGSVAGFGIKEKPIIKAGKNYHIKMAKGKYYPKTAAVAMNAISHPFGGKRRSTQKSKKKVAPRNAPPGRKVGTIAAKRTGRKKR